MLGTHFLGVRGEEETIGLSKHEEGMCRRPWVCCTEQGRDKVRDHGFAQTAGGWTGLEIIGLFITKQNKLKRRR